MWSRPFTLRKKNQCFLFGRGWWGGGGLRGISQFFAHLKNCSRCGLLWGFPKCNLGEKKGFGGGAVSSFKEEWTSRTAGVHSVTLYSRNQVILIHSQRGSFSDRGTVMEQTKMIWLQVMIGGAVGIIVVHMGTVPLGEWVLQKQPFPQWTWLGLEEPQTALVLFTSSSLHDSWLDRVMKGLALICCLL